MKDKSLGFLGAKLLALLLTAAMLAGCPMPLNTSLLDTVQRRVDEHNRLRLPDIRILVDGVEIPDGSSRDIFKGAQEGVDLNVEFTIQNMGGTDLHLRESDPVGINGEDAGLFSLWAPPDALTIRPDSSAVFTISFQLDAAGEARSALIYIWSDDPDENPFEFTVSNTELPEIQVVQGTTPIDNDGSYDFGSLEFMASLDVPFTIKNLGQVNLELTGIPIVTVSGDGFSVPSQPISPVTPLGSSGFKIRIAPNSLGEYSGDVSIANSDPDENPYTFNVSGNCIPPSVRIACGAWHTLALKKNDESLYAWGRNEYGQLGVDDKTDSLTPKEVGSLSGIVAVAAGDYHSVALDSGGKVYTWGSNAYGQLGDGTQTDSLKPVPVTDLSGIVAVAAGRSHTVALDSGGKVYTWGDNEFGQLGDGTNEDRLTPKEVDSLSGVVAVAAGYTHTIALTSGGLVYTWGHNHFGQLGNNSTADSNVPVPVTQVTDFSEIVAVAAGRYHSVALKKSDGTVWSWGGNEYGQLGDETKTDRLTPVQVTDLSGVEAVAAGYLYTVALESSGAVYAWGRNYFGQLGDETKIDRLTPVQVHYLSGVEAVAAGYAHTVALKSDGTAYAWGYNVYGQLGDGTKTDRLKPVRVVEF
jgi:alpha-tubulin suppressor-like RCC1 family protein